LLPVEKIIIVDLILIVTVSSEQLPMLGKCVELEAVPFNKKWYKQTKRKWLQWCRQQRMTFFVLPLVISDIE